MKKTTLLLPCLLAALSFSMTACGNDEAASAISTTVETVQETATNAPNTDETTEDAAAETTTDENAESASTKTASEKESSEETIQETGSADSQTASMSLTVKDGEPYTDENGKYSANIVYPVITDESGQEIAASKEISEYIDGLKSTYEENSKQEGGVYSVTTSYEVTHDGSRYLSLRLITTEVMASGNETVKTFTVDKQTGETVSLEELLGSKEALDEITEEIRIQMQEQMAADESVSYFTEESGMGFTGVTADTSYYLDEKGNLIISFNEYEVAPGYMGMVSFTIPENVSGTFD